MKRVAGCTLKPKETMKRLFVNVVKKQNTIGSLINGVISVNPVILIHHFAAER
jgi:hypothetical protein